MKTDRIHRGKDGPQTDGETKIETTSVAEDSEGDRNIEGDI